MGNEMWVILQGPDGIPGEEVCRFEYDALIIMLKSSFLARLHRATTVLIII